MLVLPTVTSNRLRGAMRCGLWSLSPVPGAGMLTRLDEYCEARQTAGKGFVGVAVTPLQVSPAWNSWSAVRPLKMTAGCPPSVVEKGSQGVFGLLEAGL